LSFISTLIASFSCFKFKLLYLIIVRAHHAFWQYGAYCALLRVLHGLS
jgi:hypothetical protein